jgi:hypothetical protein
MIRYLLAKHRSFCNYSYAEAQYLNTHGPIRLFVSAALGVCVIAVPYLLFQAALAGVFLPLAVHRFVRRLVNRGE